MSSGSKAGMPSDRHASVGGGSARSTEEAGQCPRREGAEQDSLFDEGNTAAPEAERTVSTETRRARRASEERRLDSPTSSSTWTRSCYVWRSVRCASRRRQA